MRLTLEVVSQAPQTFTPAKERQISFRGCKIPAVENLGATQDHFECFDFCDNDIIKLSNFPPLKNLRTLLLANNRLSRIAPEVFDSLPNLNSLILTNNRFDCLAALEPLSKGTRLTRLSMIDNPVSAKDQYRLYVIHLVPSLRFLDFQRIRDKERAASKDMFGGEDGGALRARMLKQDAEIMGNDILSLEPAHEGHEEVADVEMSTQTPTYAA